MSKTPRILIDVFKIGSNFQKIKEKCQASGINITAVLKGIAGDVRIVETLLEYGLSDIGDSRLDNLSSFRRYTGLKQTLLRLPALSELSEVLKFADSSLQAEMETLRLLDALAVSQNKTHQVMLMVDLGDLREGFLQADFRRAAEFCATLTKVRVTGIGTNFSCFAGVKPSTEKLKLLVKLGMILRDEYGFPVEKISGGNSSSLPLVYEGLIPEGVNHLRIGEGILLGRETLNGTAISGLEHDAFIIEAEVLQSMWKPGLPDGEIGFNAFGRTADLPELPPGYRALLNIGEQDTPLKGLTPMDPEIIILGGSSDYMVIASARRLKIGERIRFIPNYWGLLSAMSTGYIKKEYVRGK